MYFLGLDTEAEVSILLQRMSDYVGGAVADIRLVGIPGLLVSGREPDPSRGPEAYDDEGLSVRRTITFTLPLSRYFDERSDAMRRMFVAGANLPVDTNCDALLTFGFDIACLRRRARRLELFSHWSTWHEPWVAERLPAGYVFSDDVPRY